MFVWSRPILSCGGVESSPRPEHIKPALGGLVVNIHKLTYRTITASYYGLLCRLSPSPSAVHLPVPLLSFFLCLSSADFAVLAAMCLGPCPSLFRVLRPVSFLATFFLLTRFRSSFFGSACSGSTLPDLPVLRQQFTASSCCVYLSPPVGLLFYLLY